MSGFKNYDKIKSPWKVCFEQMKHFIGTECKCDQKNTKEVLLEKYYKSVVESDESQDIPV